MLADPAVTNVVAFTGGAGNTTNTGRMFVSLKPLARAERLGRPGHRPPARQARARAGRHALPAGRAGPAGRRPPEQRPVPVHAAEHRTWTSSTPSRPRMLAKLRDLPELRDVATDQQNRGLQATLVIDRDTASRLGMPAQAIDDTLYDAFGQRQVSTIFTELNQYRVVLEVAPDFQQNPDALKRDLRQVADGRPGAARAPSRTSRPRTTPLPVSHQGQFPAVTLSFNLAPGVALGDAVKAIQAAEREVGFPRDDPRELPGHGPGLPGVARQSADPHPGRAHRRLHRPRRALRELHPPDHDPVHAALGGRRRDPRAAAVPHGPRTSSP